MLKMEIHIQFLNLVSEIYLVEMKEEDLEKVKGRF